MIVQLNIFILWINMFPYRDINNYLLNFLPIRDLITLGKVNRSCRDSIQSSLYYKYIKKCRGIVSDIIKNSLKNGDLQVIQWLVNNKECTGLDELFKLCSVYGQLKIAKWIYSLGGVNHHIDIEYPFRMSCTNGHLEVAKWIYSLGGVNHHINNEYSFRMSCYNGHLKVAKWIYSLGGVDHHADNDYSFIWACSNNYLEVAKWIYSLGGVNHRANDECAFNWASYKGYLDVLKYLYSLGFRDYNV